MREDVAPSHIKLETSDLLSLPGLDTTPASSFSCTLGRHCNVLPPSARHPRLVVTLAKVKMSTWTHTCGGGRRHVKLDLMERRALLTKRKRKRKGKWITNYPFFQPLTTLMY